LRPGPWRALPCTRWGHAPDPGGPCPAPVGAAPQTLHTALPTARGEKLAVVERGGVDARPSLARAPGDLGDDRRILVRRRRLDDVAGAGLALGPDHGRTLANPAQRLAEVAAAADEGDLEGVFVDVVLLVGRRQHLGLVDVVRSDRLEDLRLHEVADARLRHH